MQSSQTKAEITQWHLYSIISTDVVGKKLIVDSYSVQNEQNDGFEGVEQRFCYMQTCTAVMRCKIIE